jgi:hypothetical protein
VARKRPYECGASILGQLNRLYKALKLFLWTHKRLDIVDSCIKNVKISVVWQSYRNQGRLESRIVEGGTCESIIEPQWSYSRADHCDLQERNREHHWLGGFQSDEE